MYIFMLRCFARVIDIASVLQPLAKRAAPFCRPFCTAPVVIDRPGSSADTMSMMQMLMASHISEGLGEVPPLPVEDKPWLTAEMDKGTVVRRAVKEVLTHFHMQPACVYQTARLCFDIAQPITAVRAWLIDNADKPGAPVITGMAFRYRGSDRFIPDAPDPGDDAARRHRPLQTFREQTETLAAGESIVAVKCSSTAPEFTSEIICTTSHGRALVFGSHGTILPWGPPDEMSSADGAPLVGFVALRKVLYPWGGTIQKLRHATCLVVLR